MYLLKLLRNKFNLFFLITFVLASLLRLGGIYPGFPPYHPDEGMSYAQGIAIVRENTLNAHGYPLSLAYPNLIPIINSILFKFIFIPISWTAFFAKNLNQIIDGIIHFPLVTSEYNRIFQLEILGERESNVLVWGRIISAAFGIGIVFLIWKLAKEMFGDKAAVFAALLVAVNYRQVLNSHLDLPDIYNAFFLILSLIGGYNLISRPILRNYTIAGILAGLSVATKFHIYALFPLVFSLLFNFPKKKYMAISLLFAGLIILLINPYHLIKFEEAREVIGNVTSKYGVGLLSFRTYPFSYLFFIGIGRLTSIVIILGLIYSLLKFPKKLFFLLSVLLPFFFLIVFYSQGGFYTRNFVTVTPILLMFPGVLLSGIFGKKKIFATFSVLIFLAMIYENLSNSITVPLEYTKPWNYKLTSEWIGKNIPQNSKIAAHSSVPLTVSGVVRLNFDPDTAFDMSEFKDEGAQFVAVNFDWATNDFYWWMTRRGRDSLNYWWKPEELLKKQFSAMALEELSDYSIFYLAKKWQAPDSTFLISKIPKVSFEKKVLLESIGRQKGGWRSIPIKIVDSGMVMDATYKGGFVYAEFFKNEEDSKFSKRRVAVKLSARSKTLRTEQIAFVVPKDAEFVVLGFEVTDKVSPEVYLQEIKLYDAKVTEDFSGFSVKPTVIDENILFPVSHGNL